MINKLFSMHNIKYIISVDDCFFAPKRENMEAAVYAEMCRSLDPFRAFLTNQDDAVAEIDAMMSMGEDFTALIYPLLNNLPDADLSRCYEICEQNGIKFTEERNEIIAFLEGLKSECLITKYLTFSSTSEANSFDAQKEGMADSAILWLLDRNFSRIGESEEAGLQLAENILSRNNDYQNYIFILSDIGNTDEHKKEDEIEAEFDIFLATHCTPNTHSFIYYISKRRLLSKKTEKIAKSLAQGFKRKACFELFQLFNSCLCEGGTAASARVLKIRQKILNYLFANKVSVRGESYTEEAARLVQIFQQDEYNRAIARKHRLIAEKARYYEKLCTEIIETIGDEKGVKSILKEYRGVELYNNYVNEQHSEIATGDIFEIESKYYILVSQACDTYLRSDGHRKLEFASLLEIQDNKQPKYSYRLSCFLEMQKPTVIYHNLKIIPFDILDLCVFNDSGKASIALKKIETFGKEIEAYTINYRNRFAKVLNTVSDIQATKNKLNDFLSGKTTVTAEDARVAYEHLESLDPNMKKYDNVEDTISFPVRRITRLNELTTIDIVKEYGITLSRIGQPFDFTEDKSQCE